MPNKKLTDKEIVKALECCSSGDTNCCNECPLDKECGVAIPIMEELMKYALDLINRLQAENERLKEDKQPMIVNSIQDDFCGVPCEFMEEKINYTQADNKRLKADIGTLESKMITLNALIEIKNDTICNLMKTVDALESQFETAKAEARKEFTERLKKEAFKINYCGSSYNVVDTDDIDNLLKNW